MDFVFKLHGNMYAVNGHTSRVLPSGVAKLNWAIPTPCPLLVFGLDALRLMGLSTRDLDPNLMRIGDLDSKTTFPPHGLDPDPSCMLCCVTACVTVRDLQSSSAMRVVCMPCEAHTTPHWIRIGESESGESGFSTHVESPIVILQVCHIALVPFCCFA